MADTLSASAIKECQTYKKLRDDILAIENCIKTHKTALKLKQDELELKLKLKRIGGDEAKAETQELIAKTTTAMAELDVSNKQGKKKFNALDKDKTALEKRLSRIDTLLTAIGGQISEEDAKRLILKKLHDIANKELLRYLNAEKRNLITAVENLWNKYAISNKNYEEARGKTLVVLNDFLAALGYMG